MFTTLWTYLETFNLCLFLMMLAFSQFSVLNTPFKAGLWSLVFTRSSILVFEKQILPYFAFLSSFERFISCCIYGLRVPFVDSGFFISHVSILSNYDLWMQINGIWRIFVILSWRIKKNFASTNWTYNVHKIGEYAPVWVCLMKKSQSFLKKTFSTKSWIF